MPISRREAKRRLINRWCSAVSELPAGREPLFGLQQFVTRENIEAVARLDLYRDYSDERRDREIVEAWTRRDAGGLRQ